MHVSSNNPCDMIIITVRFAIFPPSLFAYPCEPFDRIACIPRHSQTFSGEIRVLLRPAIAVGVAGSVHLRGSTKSTSHLRTRHSSSANPPSQPVPPLEARLRCDCRCCFRLINCHGLAANTCRSPLVKRKPLLPRDITAFYVCYL